MSSEESYLQGSFSIDAGVVCQETYRSAESRMQQEALRRHVLRVLRIWRDWFIFSDDFLNGLQVRLSFQRSILSIDPVLTIS